MEQNCLVPNFFDPNIFFDTTLVGLKFCEHGLFSNQNFFGPYFFDKTTTTTISTTTTLMGFHTIEINLNWIDTNGKVSDITRDTILLGNPTPGGGGLMFYCCNL